MCILMLGCKGLNQTQQKQKIPSEQQKVFQEGNENSWLIQVNIYKFESQQV